MKCLPEVEAVFAVFYEKRDFLDVTPHIRGLGGKYLLLLGDYPSCQTPEDQGIRTFLELVPDSRVKAMGSGSHFLPMEYPDLVLKEIREFFAR